MKIHQTFLGSKYDFKEHSEATFELKINLSNFELFYQIIYRSY